MRVAALYDVHGNLPALEAILADPRLVTAITPAEEAIAAQEGAGADVVVCGHVHVRYDRRLSPGLRLVNPGSVGAPYEGTAGAYWALLGPDVELCRTSYDVHAAAAAIRATGCPDTEWIVDSALLEPLPAADANALFESRRGS